MVAEPADRPAVVPPVQTSVFGGRSVRWSLRPGRGPVVLLLGGCAVGSWIWRPVIRRLNDHAVLTMDRPGMAGTRWPGRLPTLAEEVATLAELLHQVGAAPAVLVAHSMAGPHAEALARIEPGLVAGLVMVDASIEIPTPTPDPVAERRWLQVARTARNLMRLRPIQRLGPVVERALSSLQSRRLRLFDPASPEATAAYRDPETVAMVVAEQAAYDRQLQDLERVREAHPFPDVEVQVLTATGAEGKSWVARQAALAALLRGTQVVLPTSRHLVMLDEPDALAAAIAAVAAPTE